MDFDTLLSILSLAVAVGGLVPIFVIKEERRKELAIVVVVSLLIALTATMAVRDHAHSRQLHEVQNEIVATLSGNRWTSDQLYKQLHYPYRSVFFEALFAGVEQRRIQQAVVQVTIDDGLPVDVRVYWIEPARPQNDDIKSSGPCQSPATKSMDMHQSGRSVMETEWEGRAGLVWAPWLLFFTAAGVAFGRRRKDLRL